MRLPELAFAFGGTPYRILAPLGRGGMGVVLEAEHAALGKRVVIKLLRRQLANRPDLVDRMRVEAQILARVQHPNLVAVTDFGLTPDGRPYLVMERLYGRTLKQELRERRVLPPAEAIDYVRQALAGLAAAHVAGIVHRDVKLENLFLCDPIDGWRIVKVLDFGIAKIQAAGTPSSAGGSGPGSDARRPIAPPAFPTAEGVAMGTPRYFSPEQARGLPLDARSDLYAMGAVLYTLLAGRGPFDHAGALYEIARAHALETPAPPSEHAPQRIHPELDRLVLRSLAKSPDDRPSTAAMFSAELARIEPLLRAAPLPIRWARTERLPIFENVPAEGARREPAPDERDDGSLSVHWDSLAGGTNAGDAAFEMRTTVRIARADEPSASAVEPGDDDPTGAVAPVEASSPVPSIARGRPGSIGRTAGPVEASSPVPSIARAARANAASIDGAGGAPSAEARRAPSPRPPAPRPAARAIAARPVIEVVHAVGDALEPSAPSPEKAAIQPAARSGEVRAPSPAGPQPAPPRAPRARGLHPMTFLLVVVLSAAASAALAGAILLRALE